MAGSEGGDVVGESNADEAAQTRAQADDLRELLAADVTQAAKATVANTVGEWAQLLVLLPGAIAVLIVASIVCGLGWLVTDLTLGRLVPGLATVFGTLWLGAFGVSLFLGIRWLVMVPGRRMQRRVEAAFGLEAPPVVATRTTRADVVRGIAVVAGIAVGIAVGYGAGVLVGEGPLWLVELPLVLAVAGSVLVFVRGRPGALRSAAVGFGGACAMLAMLYTGAG